MLMPPVRQEKAQASSRSPVYAIYGGDAFLKQQALADVFSTVLGDDRDNMAVAEFNGPEAKLAEVLDECRTPSLLASVRLVCVRDADAFVSAHRASLEQYVQSPSSSGVLVLECQKLDARTKLYRFIKDHGNPIECNAPPPREMPGWLADRARRAYVCRLQGDAAQRLVDLSGTDLGQLDTELGKLASYVWPRKDIQVGDVEQLVGATRAEKVFGIADAIADRDAARALELWDQVLATDRDAPYRAVGGLAFSFRRMVEARRLLDGGASPLNIRQQLGMYADADRLARRLRRFSPRQWRGFLVKLLDIDVASKTGLGTVRLAVEKLIVESCTVHGERLRYKQG